MDTLSYKTISANKATVTKEWVIVDATDQTLGRLGAKVAKLLRGKYKPNFTPHVDCGDNVIIINADKVKLTGNKWNDRVYLSYTGYPGGQREMTPARLITKPNGEERLLKKVVKGMLPKNILGAKLLNNLYVYAGSEHKQAAQNPKMIDINSYKEDIMEVVNALGRRKRAIARIFVSEGTGKITINKRDLAEYFPSTILQYVVKQPLNKLGAAEKYDIKVNLCGGGFTGQSQALRLAIARALVKMNAEDKAALRAEGFMTRDPRSVERKKPGQPKARRRFQFSKR